MLSLFKNASCRVTVLSSDTTIRKVIYFRFILNKPLLDLEAAKWYLWKEPMELYLIFSASIFILFVSYVLRWNLYLHISIYINQLMCYKNYSNLKFKLKLSESLKTASEARDCKDELCRFKCPICGLSTILKSYLQLQAICMLDLWKDIFVPKYLNFHLWNHA